jgi:hypothetical protein
MPLDPPGKSAPHSFKFLRFARLRNSRAIPQEKGIASPFKTPRDCGAPLPQTFCAFTSRRSENSGGVHPEICLPVSPVVAGARE